MGCAPITKVKKGSQATAREFTSDSAKLPPEVLEGFGKILKTIAQPVEKKMNPKVIKVTKTTKSEEAEESEAARPQQTANQIEDAKSEKVKDQNPIKLPPVSKSVLSEINKKQEMIKRHIEHKITIKSELRIGEIKDDHGSSESEDDPKEENQNESSEKPLLEYKGEDQESNPVPVIDIGDIEDEVRVNIGSGINV